MEPNAENSCRRDAIKEKLRQNFDGKIVRKDLTKKIKEGANVPVYVLEFLLGQYCSSDDEEIIEQGVQSASGVPLMCDEPADFRSFRLGLFGLDKWADVDRSVGQLAAALDRLGIAAPEKVAATA